MANRAGQQLGNYRLAHLLGKGGFADVYLGEHVHLLTQAAVKVLHTSLANHNQVEKFRNEARIIARLEHPHIVRVLDFDLEDDTPFLVMSYAPQGSLRDRHPKGTILPLTSIVSYVKQVASALQCAHDQKLIHRDVKPENMLLDQSGNILLSDFGIAIMAHSTYSMSVQNEAGTIPYMAPEQIQGKAQQASDQYALGIVVYEWLTGSCPFHGSYWEVATQHIAVPPSSLQERVPSILPNIERVVMTALAKDSKQRFATVQAFATALEQASQLAPIPHALPLVTTTLDQSLQSTEMKAPLEQPSPSSNQSLKTSPLEELTQPAVTKILWHEWAQHDAIQMLPNTPQPEVIDTLGLTSQPAFTKSFSTQPPLYNFKTAPLMQPPLSSAPTPSTSKAPLPSHQALIHNFRSDPLLTIVTLLIILVLFGIASLTLFELPAMVTSAPMQLPPVSASPTLTNSSTVTITPTLTPQNGLYIAGTYKGSMFDQITQKTQYSTLFIGQTQGYAPLSGLFVPNSSSQQYPLKGTIDTQGNFSFTVQQPAGQTPLYFYGTFQQDYLRGNYCSSSTNSCSVSTGYFQAGPRY